MVLVNPWGQLFTTVPDTRQLSNRIIIFTNSITCDEDFKLRSCIIRHFIKATPLQFPMHTPRVCRANIINVMTFDIRLFCEVLCVVWNAAEINYHLSVTFAADALQTLCPCIISLCSRGICWHAEPFRRQSPAVICGFFFTFIIVASKFIIHTFMLFLHLTGWNQCSWLQPQGSRNDAYNMSLYRPGAACRSNFEWYAYMRYEGIWAQ